MQNPHQRLIQHPSDHGSLKAPAMKTLHQPFLATALDHEQHPLLRFRQQELVRRHAALPGRHAIKVQFHTKTTLGSHFGATAGEAGRSHVLSSHHITAGEGLQTGLDQTFLQERIPHLHRRTVVQGIRTEFRTGEAGPPHAITTGGAADVDDGVPDAGRTGLHDLTGLHQTERHRIDQGIAGIGGIKGNLAADGGNADTIAVMSDPGDDALHQADIGGILQRSEPQRIEQGNGSGSHRENVPQDAADTGSRPLEGFDGRGMVVTFDLEGKAMPVAEIHHTSVLPWPDENARSIGGKPAEQGSGIAIATVLRPHHAEHSQFGSVRSSPQTFADLLPVSGLQSLGPHRFSNVVSRGIGSSDHQSESTLHQCCRPCVSRSDPGILIPVLATRRLRLIPEFILPILERISVVQAGPGWC